MKETDEKFFEEVARALEKNDAEALDILMEKEEPEVVEPKQEVAEPESTEPEVKEDEVPAEPRAEEDLETEEPEDEVATLKKQLEEARTAQHKLQSDAGRVPGLQRKLAELDKKLQTMAERSADKNDAGDVTELASIKDALNNEHFQLIKESDPTLAAALEAALTGLVRANKKESVEVVREVTSAFREDEEEEALRSEWNKLVEEAPDAPQIFQSKEWKQYKFGLTPEQRAIAESAYAEDVLIALGDFNSKFRKAAPQETKPSPVSEERERKLKTKTPGSGAPAAPAAKRVDDEESLFKQAYEEVLKQNQRIR